MASRGYDPYDYYYTAPYYYQQQQPVAVPARSRGGFFPAAGDAETAAPRSVSIPVHFVGSDPEITARSEEQAAVRIQAAARGLAARRAVRAVREVEREAEETAAKVAREAEALRGDARGRIAVGEALMRLLLRLDAVRGAREYRKRVTRRVLALQDAVDALEPNKMVAEETEADEMGEEESEAATDLPDATEQSGVTEAAAEMEVRRVEDAERRQRRGKKLRNKEGKRSNHSKCYTD